MVLGIILKYFFVKCSLYNKNITINEQPKNPSMRSGTNFLILFSNKLNY